VLPSMRPIKCSARCALRGLASRLMPTPDFFTLVAPRFPPEGGLSERVELSYLRDAMRTMAARERGASVGSTVFVDRAMGRTAVSFDVSNNCDTVS